MKDKWFYFPTVLMVLYFLYRLWDFSKWAYIFPMEKTNDIASYIAQLYFLVNYGFHQVVPHWENGFILFESYPPGWFYFALPLYYLFRDYLVATFASVILMFVIIFLAMNYLGKINKMSLVKRIAFFIFLFGNPIAIGNFIRLGRVTELFGWMNFVILSSLLLIYLNKKLNLKFYMTFIIFYSVMLLSHPAITILFTFTLLGFLITRIDLEDKVKLILSGLVSIAITSFWWIGFILTLDREDVSVVTEGLLTFNKAWLWTSVASLIIPILLWFSFYFYYKENKRKEELLFFIPIFVLSLLFISKAIVFVPIFNNIYPDVYLLVFLLFSLYYFLRTRDFSNFNNLIKIGLSVMLLVSIGVSYYHTPLVREYTQHEYDALSIMENIEGRFFVYGIPGSRFHENGGYIPAASSNMYNYYSYGPVYHDLITVSPVIFAGSNHEYRESLWDTMRFGREMKCSEFKNGINKLGAKEILTFEDNCEFLRECGFEFKLKNGSSCLFLS
ncbi:hypothetical protein J4442_01360 [Candidatus Woesearchaeota archaeon]|nr:hypothetical protein [Candidatus Woesearchaeota archaeon]